MPEEFRDAVAQMRAARLRPEVLCEEMPAPQRIAPFASALSADVTVDGEDVGTGRIVLLHDPAGNDAWGGTFRCVAYARAELDPEIAADPFLAEVAWTWLSRGARRPRRRVRRAVRHRHQGVARRASAGWPTTAAARSSRSGRRGPRAEPAAPSTSARTSRPGASCCAPPRGWSRCPRGSPPCPAVEASAAADDARTRHRAPPDDNEPEEVPACPLLELRDGLPPVVETPEALAETVAAFAAGTGPVAIDAERASGYRYSARAYLVQLRREGSGTALVDPIAFDDLAPLSEALGGTEWILHAASQDLPCLTELGLRPTPLFDTELAGRLLGYPRVGLATLVEEILGRRLRKEHSAVDWSTRPLPAAVAGVRRPRRRAARRAARRPRGRAGGGRQVGVGAAGVRAPRQTRPRPGRGTDPWRRTSGLHRVRGRRALAAVRALWQARDEIAAQRDVTPGRIIPDSAIVEAATALPQRPGHAAGPAGLPRPRRRALRQRVGRRAARRPRAARRGRAAADRRPVRRPAAAPRLGRPGPGGGRAAGPGPRRAQASSPRSSTCRSRTC